MTSLKPSRMNFGRPFEPANAPSGAFNPVSPGVRPAGAQRRCASRRRMGQWFVAWMVLAVVLALAPAANAARLGETTIKTASVFIEHYPRPVLVIENFHVESRDPRFGDFGRSFVGALYIALAPHHGRIHVIPQEVLWRTLQKLRLPQGQWGASRVFRKDVYQALPLAPTLVLKGTIFETGGQFTLDGQIEKLRVDGDGKPQSRTLPTVRTSLEHLLPDSRRYAKLVVEAALKLHGVDRAFPRVVIGCFVDPAGSSQEKTRFIAKNLIDYLRNGLDGVARVISNAVSFDQACGTNVSDGQKKLLDNADAVVSGTLTFTRNQLREVHINIEVKKLSSANMFPESRPVFVLKTIKVEKQSFLQLRDEVLKTTRGFLEAAITSSGSWNEKELRELWVTSYTNESLANVANLLLSSEKTNLAVARLNPIIDRDSSDSSLSGEVRVKVHLLMAKAMRLQGNTKDANDQLEKAKTAFQDHKEQLKKSYQLGRLNDQEFKQNLWEQEQLELELVIESGHLNADQRRIEDATSSFERAFESNAYSSLLTDLKNATLTEKEKPILAAARNAHERLGELYFQLKKPIKAEKIFRQLKAGYGESAVYQSHLAAALVRQKNFNGAIGEAREGLKRWQKDEKLLAVLIFSYGERLAQLTENRDYSGAIKAIDELKEFDSGNLSLIFFRARLLVERAFKNREHTRSSGPKCKISPPSLPNFCQAIVDISEGLKRMRDDKSFGYTYLLNALYVIQVKLLSGNWETAWKDTGSILQNIQEDTKAHGTPNAEARAIQSSYRVLKESQREILGDVAYYLRIFVGMLADKDVKADDEMLHKRLDSRERRAGSWPISQLETYAKENPLITSRNNRAEIEYLSQRVALRIHSTETPR